jgi:alpha-L-glutamate ligase-like protein
MSTLAKNAWLTLQQRNLHYIAPNNQTDAIESVDNKVLSKDLAQQSCIPTPKTFVHIQNVADFNEFLRSAVFLKGRFVLKPNHGSSGRGILISTQFDQNRQQLKLASGQWMPLQQIHQHVADIFAGVFSLGYSKDSLLVEELIEPSEIFCGFSLNGLPDIRLVVYKGYPVMAMLRLATLFSEGKSNLSQGAIGVGLCLQTGNFKHAIQHEQTRTAHPDTGLLLKQIRVTAWDQLLKMAAQCYDIYRLGYMGVDLTLNKAGEPLLLECNARPGLMIQQANQQNLQPLLVKIDALKTMSSCADQRANYAKKYF